MLGLSTHEPYFYILRETVMTKREIDQNKSGNKEAPRTEGQFHEKAKKEIPINFQFVKLHVFREYLDYEFKYLNLPFPYDLEKVIDDFVFMCFFVGNDFLPHLPCLSIRDGGIDCLMYLYKRKLPFMGGNMIENGTLNLLRVEMFMNDIGDIEEALLRNAVNQQEFRKRRQNSNVSIETVALIIETTIKEMIIEEVITIIETTETIEMMETTEMIETTEIT
jgi:5'-3' exoribonuclease 2